MKYLMTCGLVALLASCGAQGNPVTPKLGFGIGPNGIKPKVSVGARGAAGNVNLTPNGASVSPAGLPLSVGL